MTMKLRQLVLYCAIASLAACTGHNSEYASQGYPDGTVVGSTRDVYTATNATDRLSAELPDKNVPSVIPVGYETDGLTPSAALRGDRGAASGFSDQQQIAEARRIEANLRTGTARYDPTTFTPQGVPTPVATQPRVLRIWVAPWTDARGDTIVAGYVFANVDAMTVPMGSSLAAGGANYLQSVQTIEARSSPTGIPPGTSPPVQRGPVRTPDRPATIPVSTIPPTG